MAGESEQAGGAVGGGDVMLTGRGDISVAHLNMGAVFCVTSSHSSPRLSDRDFGTFWKNISVTIVTGSSCKLEKSVVDNIRHFEGEVKRERVCAVSDEKIGSECS